MSDKSSNKTVGILSYLTLIGLILAFVLNKGENKSDFSSFHLRQGLGLTVISFLSGILAFVLGLIPFLKGMSSLIYSVISIAVFIFIIMGLIAAIKGEKKEVPFIGALIQDKLKNLS